jgi:hypothetical protein
VSTIFTMEPLDAHDPDSYIYSMEAVNEFIMVLSKFCGFDCCSMFAAVCLQQCCDRTCRNYEKILELEHSWVGNFCMRQDGVGSEANVVGGQQL